MVLRFFVGFENPFYIFVNFFFTLFIIGQNRLGDIGRKKFYLLKSKSSDR